jgi:hypothetical protein
MPGCAVIQGLVVVAGGYRGGTLWTTDVINIATRTIRCGPKMQESRYKFHLAVLPAPGGTRDRVVALGGQYHKVCDIKSLDMVEEWLPGPDSTWRCRPAGGATWQAVTGLKEERYYYGAVVIPEALVCP